MPGVPLTPRAIMAAVPTTVQRPKATPGTTGPGAMLTDGEMLYEVTDCCVRRIKAGQRTLHVPHRRLRCATVDIDVPRGTPEPMGAWVPMAEVRALDVVRPVAYKDPEPKPRAS